MIERIARRAGGFASTTALRWLGALGDSVPDVELPSTSGPNAAEKLRKPLGGGAVVGAIALASSNKLVRAGVAKGLLKITQALRTDDSQSGPRSNTGSSRGSSSARRNGATGENGSNGNGGGHSLSAKTRTELYEMAKKKDIPGRSSMSKQQLAKALREA